VTPRRDCRGAPLNSRTNASLHFERTDVGRPRLACATAHVGRVEGSAKLRREDKIIVGPSCRRQVAEHAGLQAEEWTPRELRHSFVSLLSSAGIPIEDIAHLVGHANTRTTEKVYRKELRPVLRGGAKAMDDLFKAHQEASEPPNLPPAFNENQTER
jgi:hypothetical protein